MNVNLSNNKVCPISRQCMELTYNDGIKLSICPYLIVSESDCKFEDVSEGLSSKFKVSATCIIGGCNQV